MTGAVVVAVTSEPALPVMGDRSSGATASIWTRSEKAANPVVHNAPRPVRMYSVA
jgi:hypothetical protein